MSEALSLAEGVYLLRFLVHVVDSCGGHHFPDLGGHARHHPFVTLRDRFCADCFVRYRCALRRTRECELL